MLFSDPLVQLVPTVEERQIFVLGRYNGVGASWSVVKGQLEQVLAALTQGGLNRDIVID
ncbi:MAG: hypothetical protein AAGF30_03495 [Pseudomonadota bacterium]